MERPRTPPAQVERISPIEAIAVVQFAVVRVEVRREPDPSAWSVVAEDVERLQAARDLVAVLNVDGDGAALLLGIARGRASIPSPIGEHE